MSVIEPPSAQPVFLVAASDPVLWRRSDEVTDIAGQVRPWLDGMRSLLRDRAGAGLAAPQVGIGYRFFVTIFEECRVVINPKIIQTFGCNVSAQEGCLTWPGRMAFAKRAESIRVVWLNQRGVVHEQCFMGKVARVFQHELDHLDGKCIFERS